MEEPHRPVWWVIHTAGVRMTARVIPTLYVPRFTPVKRGDACPVDSGKCLFWLPDLYCFIVTARDDVAAIGRPGDGIDAFGGVSAIGEYIAAIGGVPDLDGCISAAKGASTARGDALAIGRPGQGVDGT